MLNSLGGFFYQTAATPFLISIVSVLHFFCELHLIFVFELLTVETVILGFQHFILALGTAIMIPSFLVPLMGGSDVSPLF